MPLLSFMKQFVEPVLSGEKKQTIRKTRKRPFKTGDKLYIYTGSRFKPKKIAEGQATLVQEIFIFNQKDDVFISINGHLLTGSNQPSREEFAKADGFNSLEEFKEFFTPKEGDKFLGQLIKFELTNIIQL